MVIESLPVLVASGTFLGSLTGAAMHHMQTEDMKRLPVMYSGVDRLRSPNVAVAFYAAVNDLVMAIAESWNTVAARNRLDRFAEACSHHGVMGRARYVVQCASQLDESLEEPQKLFQRCVQAQTALVQAWGVDDTRWHSTGASLIISEARRAQVKLRELALIDIEEAIFDPKLTPYRVPLAKLEAGSGPYRGFGNNRARRLESRRFQQTFLRDSLLTVSQEELETALNEWLRCAQLQRRVQAAKDMLTALQTAEKRIDCLTVLESAGYTEHGRPLGFAMARGLYEDLAQLVTALDVVLRCTEAARLFATAVGGGIVESTVEQKGADAGPRVIVDRAIDLYRVTFPGSSIPMDRRPEPGRTLKSFGAGTFVGAFAVVIIRLFGA